MGGHRDRAARSEVKLFGRKYHPRWSARTFRNGGRQWDGRVAEQTGAGFRIPTRLPAL